ncbi:ROK family protein [Micromonospora sp. NPDC005413]|uniref:ROK family protein n=1 Tax=Micromonospora sp. NPDC005413 TaxID=3154563 RepID=UPI0033B0C5BB
MGVDLGGTKVLTVAITPDGAVQQRCYDTHHARGEVEVVDLVAAAVLQCAADQEVTAVGLAVAAWLTADRSTVTIAVNLGLCDVRLGEAVTARLGVPVILENDGNAAAVGEARFGAARGSRLSIMLSVGTGVGGGVVIDGRVLAGGHGLAGELGHMSLDDQGPACVCGGRGCLECYASGLAIARSAGTTNAQDAVAAARQGDPAALSALESAGIALGRGIAQLSAALDPDVVVIGGGVAAGAGDLLLQPIRRAVRNVRSLSTVVDPPEIRLAACGPEAGALGAAAMVVPRRS